MDCDGNLRPFGHSAGGSKWPANSLNPYVKTFYVDSQNGSETRIAWSLFMVTFSSYPIALLLRLCNHLLDLSLGQGLQL